MAVHRWGGVAPIVPRGRIPVHVFLPMIGQLVAFFLVNAMNWEALDPDSGLYANPNTPCINRAILVFGLVLQLGCLTVLYGF